MDKFWENIMNCLLDTLYHGALPEDGSWCQQYTYEIENMIEDIKNFHQDNRHAGFEVSNESMARFFCVYRERAYQ